MNEQDFRALFRQVEDIYRLSPETAKKLRERILAILHAAQGSGDSDPPGLDTIPV